MNAIDRYFPWVVVGAAGLFLIVLMFPTPDAAGDFQLNEAGKVLVVDQGRPKPLDTLARNSLMIISSRETFKDENGKTQPAIVWLMDVMTSRLSNSGKAEKYKVFRIENDQLLGLLGLEKRPGDYRYSLEEFGDKLSKIEAEEERARAVEPKLQSTFDVKVIQLAEHVRLFMELAMLRTPLWVPPEAKGEEWKSLPQAMKELRAGQELHAGSRDSPAARTSAEMLLAYAQGDVKGFNQALAEHAKYLDKQQPDQAQAAGFEAFFNHFAPFFWCRWLYLIVFGLACLSWVVWHEPLGRAAFWLAVLLAVVHTWAMFARMYLMDRPFVFVTNLYSSAVFIGWVGVLVALLIEVKTRLGIGTVVAGVLGFCTLLLAPILSGGSDTMGQMIAVLNTTFWLATHVTCVTFGYSATLIAGILGAILVVRGVFTRDLDRDLYRLLGRLIYGMVCFAIFLSFTGTVLGGLWADVSWGRFWGWDPKENGALLIVLMNALILHARWAGLIQQRGMAVLAIFGNVITLWSWFGTNQLGIGLHAYGFSHELTIVLLTGWGLHVALGLIGLMPLQSWQSYQAMMQEPRPAGKKERARGAALAPKSGRPSTGFKPGLGRA
jgi:ABC-type transport system involved in cytochrome c biogenesis permease subunit